jgi:hypothetical protein
MLSSIEPTFPDDTEAARRSRFFRGKLSRENTNVDQDEEPDDQACADDQNSQRRPIEKPRARLDRGLDDMSTFIVHEIASGRTLYRNGWMRNRFRRPKDELRSHRFKLGH